MPDGLNHVFLLFGQIHLKQDVTHAQDGIHGCAHFMADTGQELFLHPGTLLCHFTRFSQFFNLPLLCHIVEDAGVSFSFVDAQQACRGQWP